MRICHLLIIPFVVSSFIHILTLPVRADEPRPEDLKAQEVLDRSARTYADCKSYYDSGVVKTASIRDGGFSTRELPFATAFVRPDRFRFEYKVKEEGELKDTCIVWANGEKVQSWWHYEPEIEIEESLGLALAGATGVSRGSAHTIPSLLLPNEVTGRKLTDITEAKRIDDAKLNKVDCFCIEGKFGDWKMTLWLDQKHFLVRQISTVSKSDKVQYETTTTYEPAINEEIPAKKLEFNPAKRK